MKKIIPLFLLFLFTKTLIASEKPSIALESILPSEICIYEVSSFELIEESSHSAIYEIRTNDGGVVYQVVSSAALNLLPSAAKYACVGLIKSPVVCDLVFKVGSVLIQIYEDNIKEKAAELWKTRITGENGLATILTKTIEEARDGQLAFEESAEQTNFPWVSPTIRKFLNHKKRLGSE